ncbi:hypothetical protein [Solimonas sp. SE-A11]|uniref:hypothetical protein n=1 Tax=Solimonas sp. SE-A11 TaxID=3054954 RepID=UPI00259CE5FF|nr:hypothetical protein [Solimonas sp. SE-A11]MDM4772264.1 hypothetical protein [Solimonas sp. SE-A11]
MKRSASAAAVLMGVLFSLPALAQDPAADEAVAPESAEVAPAEEMAAEAPADTEAAADATAADAAGTEAAPADASAEAADASAEAAPADGAAAELSAESAPAEEAPVEEAASEEAPAEETASEDSGEPFHFYLGVDKAEITLALSDTALETAFGGDELESSMYRIRAGMRLLDAVGLELHYGVADDKDDGAKKFEIGEYYGIFVVPTGSLFELVEISVPIGYSSMKAERGAASETFDGVSYGVNLEVPITLNSEWFPDIRIGGGGLVYRADRDSRVYGYHFGVRLDFKI